MTHPLVVVLRHCLAREVGARPDASELTLPGEGLSAMAARQRVVPVIAPWAGELGLGDDDLARIVVQQRRNTNRGLRNASWVAALCAAMAGDGVRVMVLKGAPLSLVTTGSLNGRHVGDVDLLVHPDDLGSAQGVLVEAGMAPITGSLSPSEGRHHRWVRWVDHHRNYSATDRPLVELHWRTSRHAMSGLGFDELWRNRDTVRIGGTSVACPGEVHMLLHVSVHAALHQFVRLQWAVDTARLHRDASPTVAIAAARRAEQLGVSQAFEMGATVAEMLVSSDRPWGSLGGRRVEWTARRLAEHDCSRSLGQSGNMALQYLYNLAALQGVGSRTRVLGDLLLPAHRLAPSQADRERSLPAALGWRAREWVTRNAPDRARA